MTDERDELSTLLAAYQHALRCAGQLPRLGTVRAGDGRILRHVPLAVTRAFLAPLIAVHARSRVQALERALHCEAALTGADRAASLNALAHFRDSLPVVATRRYVVGFLGAVIAIALLISNVARALAPTELDQARHAMSDMAGAIVTVKTDALIDGAEKFTVGSAIATVVVVTLSLYLVAAIPLGSFRLKRILFNRHPSSAEDLAHVYAATERRRAAGLYELEARVFAAHELPRPVERPLDLLASAVLALFPLLLGVGVIATDDPRRALEGSSGDLAVYVLLPAALCLLIVVPLAKLYRLADVLADRRAGAAPLELSFPPEELSPVWRRTLAMALDLLLALVPFLALAFGVVAVLGDGDAAGAVMLLVVVPVALAAVTIPFMCRDGEHAGQSLGKQALGIRVVDASGAPPTPVQLVIRELLVKGLLLTGVAFVLLWIPTLLNAASPRLDRQRRALEDRVAATRVVRARAPGVETAPAPLAEDLAVA